MSGSRRHALAVLMVVVGLAAGCSGASSGAMWRENPSASAAPDLARFNTLLADLAERLQPGLVQVSVRRTLKEDTPREESPELRRGTGSGFIIDPSGLIVTNAHVVDGAGSIQVRLNGGKRFQGKVVGRDNRVDLALLKIEGATGLTALPLGASNRLRVGEFVLALGSPFGLEHSVAFGIVSRKGAPLMVATPGFDFIQTDAAVNPGNSGGPLVNMAGEVVGINSMAARNGSIGFAIPVNLVKGLLPQLAEKGKVEWGWLGVSIGEVSDEDQIKYNLKEARGVLIRQVVAGQPADRGGVKANDVVLAVNGDPIEEPRDLQRIIASTPVGQIVKLSVMREGKPTELSVTVGVYQGSRARGPAPTPSR